MNRYKALLFGLLAFLYFFSALPAQELDLLDQKVDVPVEDFSFSADDPNTPVEQVFTDIDPGDDSLNWGKFRQWPVVSQGVQVWEGGRSVWDLIYGSATGKGLTVHRGDITEADSKDLRGRLDATGKPYGPTEIFLEARKISQSDREALQRSYAMSIDEYGCNYKPMAGNSNKYQSDKYSHFFVSAIMAHRSNADASFNIGWGKEVADGTGALFDDDDAFGYDEEDLMADAQGASFGQSLHSGVVEKW